MNALDEASDFAKVVTACAVEAAAVATAGRVGAAEAAKMSTSVLDEPVEVATTGWLVEAAEVAKVRSLESPPHEGQRGSSPATSQSKHRGIPWSQKAMHSWIMHVKFSLPAR